MAESVSWQLVAIFWGIIGSSFGFTWMSSRNAAEGDKRLHDRCDSIMENNALFRERIAREYIRKEDNETLENRLDQRLKRIEDKFDALIASSRKV